MINEVCFYGNCVEKQFQRQTIILIMFGAGSL